MGARVWMLQLLVSLVKATLRRNLNSRAPMQDQADLYGTLLEITSLLGLGVLITVWQITTKLSRLNWRWCFNTVFEGQESASGLAGGSDSGSHEDVVELLAGTVVTQLENLLPSSLTWLLAGDLKSLPCGPLYRVAWVSSRHGSWLLLELLREREGQTDKESVGQMQLVICLCIACKQRMVFIFLDDWKNEKNNNFSW